MSLTFLGALGLVMFQNRHWNISIGKAQTDEETISTTVKKRWLEVGKDTKDTSTKVENDQD